MVEIRQGKTIGFRYMATEKKTAAYKTIIVRKKQNRYPASTY
jgi:hypothetical protein